MKKKVREDKVAISWSMRDGSAHSYLELSCLPSCTSKGSVMRLDKMATNITLHVGWGTKTVITLQSVATVYSVVKKSIQRRLVVNIGESSVPLSLRLITKVVLKLHSCCTNSSCDIIVSCISMVRVAQGKLCQYL